MRAGLFFCWALCPLAAQTSAVIDIDTSRTTPVSPNFSGVNAEASFPVEYWDYRFNALAAKLGLGWVRFPGGAESDIYNWQTGLEDPNWFALFANLSAGPGPNVVMNVQGKGGARLLDAANRANLLGVPLIICVNAFTDSPQSAGQLAAWVKANNIRVAAWELANEAYLFPSFFATSSAYLDAMKPYRDAIKAVYPDAVVSIFARDPNSPAANSLWNQGIAAYSNKYWDAITIHHYLPQSTGAFSQWMADETGALLTLGDTLFAGNLVALGPTGVKFLVTEFDPSIPNDPTTGANSITDGTLWGGIYSAEYLMRLSTVPAVLHAGPHAIERFAGVSSSSDQSGPVQKAAQAGTSIDTLTLDFGFYLSAQAVGLSILNGVINNATQVSKTTVTGGALVPATGVTAGSAALYAASYTNAQGGMLVVIVNKSATTHQVTIRVNGTPATGTFPLQLVSASDPSAVNSPMNPNTIALQTAVSANPVTIPAYSIVRVDLKTPPVATFYNSASYQPGLGAPSALVTAFGSGFASQALVDGTMPAVLGDTSITVTDAKGNSLAAPIYYVSPSQASFLIPQTAAPGAATVKVARSGNTVLTGALSIAAVSPGIYTANGNGAGVAAAVVLRSSAPSTSTLAFNCQAGVALSCLSSPISLGATTETVYLEIYGTGIRAAQKVEVFVAGQTVPVLAAGAQGQYQGLDQINISLPRTLAGAGESSLYIVADGQASNLVSIRIQ